MLDTVITEDYISRMYFKLFSSIVSSSIWSESSDVCKVWITMLALADRTGCVYGSPAGLARICAVSEDVVRAALGKFMAEDLSSSDLEREPERKGRRIEVLSNGGWQILNYEYYRTLRDSDVRRSQIKEAVSRYRRKSSVIASNPLTSNVIPSEADQSQIRDISETRTVGASRPQSIDEVKAYWTEKDLLGDPEAFWHHFEEREWHAKGEKRPMKDWRRAARGWSRREGSGPSSMGRSPARPSLEGLAPRAPTAIPSWDEMPEGIRAIHKRLYDRTATDEEANLYASWREAWEKARATS